MTTPSDAARGAANDAFNLWWSSEDRPTLSNAPGNTYRVAQAAYLAGAAFASREGEAVAALRAALIACKQHLELAIDQWSPVRGSDPDDDLILDSMHTALGKARASIGGAS